MKKNKKIIVLISIISVTLILIILGGIFAYLYVTTDMFKSNKELFAKYFGQNEEIFQKLTDLKVVENLEKLKDESKYEINTDVKMGYSEGGEISNVVNNLSLKLDIQRDKDEQYAYANGQILYEGEEYIQTELIKEKNIYGVRFTDAFQQFITIKRDESFGNVMNDFGFTDEQTEEIRQLFDDETMKNNKEQIITLTDKYINIIKSVIINGEFSKQKNINISYDTNNINANAYTVLISSQQIQNMLVEVLNNLKNEEILVQNIDEQYDIETQIDNIIKSINEEIEIPTVKIITYVYKQRMVKTVFEIGKYNIILENTEQNQELKTKIIYTELGDESLPQIEITISKINNENEEKIKIEVELINEEESRLITFSNLLELSPQIKISTELGYEKGITIATITMKNDINVDQAVKRSEILGEQNSKLINSIKSENRKEVVDKLKQLTLEKMNERINLLMEKMITSNNDESVENEVTQVDINKFNAKFEFYTGDEVSTENVKMLLDVIKENLSSYEIISDENSEGTNNNTTQENKLNIKLNIEKDKKDEESIEKILEKISSNKKYKVSIKYNEANGLIDYITIMEI